MCDVDKVQCYLLIVYVPDLSVGPDDEALENAFGNYNPCDSVYSCEDSLNGRTTDDTFQVAFCNHHSNYGDAYPTVFKVYAGYHENCPMPCGNEFDDCAETFYNDGLSKDQIKT